MRREKDDYAKTHDEEFLCPHLLLVLEIGWLVTFGAGLGCGFGFFATAYPGKSLILTQFLPSWQAC